MTTREGGEGGICVCGGERTRERGGLCEGEGRPRGGGGTEGGGRPWMAWSHAECAHLLCSLQMGL